MRSFLIALTCTLAPVAVQAQSYEAYNRLTVVPISNSDFEVIESRGEGPRGIWCAAADYAQHRIGVNRGRIYIKSGRGPSRTVQGRKGVVFTTQDSAAQNGSGGSVTIRQPGYSLLVNHAIQFCRDYQIELNDISFLRKVLP